MCAKQPAFGTRFFKRSYAGNSSNIDEHVLGLFINIVLKIGTTYNCEKWLDEKRQPVVQLLIREVSEALE